MSLRISKRIVQDILNRMSGFFCNGLVILGGYLIGGFTGAVLLGIVAGLTELDLIRQEIRSQSEKET